MSKLERLITLSCLMSALAPTALAGEIQSPPCTPGEIQSPPCATAQLMTDDSTNSNITEAPPTETIVVGTIVDNAVGAFLSLF
jgi:hypothetical protein